MALSALCPGFASAQAVEQGSIIIDPYYGFPNFGKKFADGFDFVEGIKVKGLGPLGLRAEYMVADKFGLGVDFIYNSFSLNGTIDSLNNDETVHSTYDYKYTTSRIRLQARFNYHFVEDDDHLDAYFGVGAGTNFRRYAEDTDMPNYEEFQAIGTLLPVSMRVALGVRYYFTDNIGLNAEIGVGGPVMSFGVSFKF